MQGVCKKSQVNRAVDLVEDMLNKIFVPDSLSYTTLLNSLCRKKKLREGRPMDAVKVFAQPLQWKKSYQLLRNFRFQDNFKLGYQWYRPCLYTTATLVAATTSYLPIITFFLAVLLE
ncbi:hypothetical protein PVK06_008050 [Gossypium arboreum]|uniref:Pentatricopeptide repeat-containing protein n=1 Tax=Gossypium arboreum TaxID=29729 RepID=A0ABR0QIY6_GOSAR|nr:hypothetical protein PVK06_008050 [Gossypium arboreum]